MKFDFDSANKVCVEYEREISYGVIDNGTCVVCKKSFGHHHLFPYKMIKSDEECMEETHFIVAILNL